MIRSTVASRKDNGERIGSGLDRRQDCDGATRHQPVNSEALREILKTDAGGSRWLGADADTTGSYLVGYRAELANDSTAGRQTSNQMCRWCDHGIAGLLEGCAPRCASLTKEDRHFA